jgi:glycosyltransferase involved in cell wall biosynthesis
MPSTPPRAPRHRAGGPVLCYVDVTETLRSGWRAGIQRVVRELFRNLPTADPDLELVAVCWSKVHGRFRRLDAAEYASMLAPTGTQQPAGAAPPPTALRRALALAMHRGGAAPLVYRYRRRRELAAVPAAHRDLLLERFEPGSFFLDLDASWNPTTRARSELLPELRSGGVTTVALQYDLLPATHPQWFIPQMVDVFLDHVDAHLRAGSTFLCISEHTRETLIGHAVAIGLPVPATSVVPLGVTPLASSAAGESGVSAPYFLVVGTVEPRKNHAVILDAFEKLQADHPETTLVVVGRPGWNNGPTIDRLRSGPDGVDWRTHVSDAELDALYADAHAVIVASVTEGFGLPVIEALQRGTPVVSADGGALPEAGGELVEYFDPTSAPELHALLLRHVDDAAHHRARRELARSYEPVSWAASAAAVASALHATVDR